MDENSLFTPFDEISQTRELQMLKTIIPYMPHDSQKQMTLMESCGIYVIMVLSI